MTQNFKFAFRQSFQSPGFSTVTAMTVALGTESAGLVLINRFILPPAVKQSLLFD